jgi:hypothetical protein
MKDYSHLTEAEWEQAYAAMSDWEKLKVNVAMIFFFLAVTAIAWVPAAGMIFVALNH